MQHQNILEKNLSVKICLLYNAVFPAKKNKIVNKKLYYGKIFSHIIFSLKDSYLISTNEVFLDPHRVIYKYVRVVYIHMYLYIKYLASHPA